MESKLNEKDDDFFTPTAQPIEPDIEQGFETQDGRTIIPTYVCEICVETKPLNFSFNIKDCSHIYCVECTVKYIESKLDDNVTRITCPVMNCKGVLDLDYCREILPINLFNRWGKSLCESSIHESEKFYCPYEDCSALLIHDGKKGTKHNFECPFCKRVFCVRCKVAWHEDLDCTTFQKLKVTLELDAKLVDLAKRKKWRQCPNPNCNYYVEKTAGCDYVKCKCGKASCYNCGADREIRIMHICNQRRSTVNTLDRICAGLFLFFILFSWLFAILLCLL